MNKWLFGTAAASAAGLSALANYFFCTAIPRQKRHGTGPKLNSGTGWEQYSSLIKERREWLARQKQQKISIRSRDGLRLEGLYFPAENCPEKRLVVCFHGYRSNGVKEFAAYVPFYKSMGYSVLLVDLRAHGESGGEYVGFGCLDRFDCVSWVEYAARHLGNGCEIVLHGVSMGASTVLMAAGLPLPGNVKAIVADCGFTSPWEVFAHVLRRNYRLPPFPLVNLTSAVCGTRAGYRLDGCSTLDAVRRTCLPVLLIHGSKDDFVPLWMSRANYAACASDKRLLIVENAGHAESYFRNTPLYEKTVREFLETQNCRRPLTKTRNSGII